MSSESKYLVVPSAELRKLIAGKREFGSLEALCIDLCGGVSSAGRMLHRLLGWWGKGSHPDGWVWKDYGDWYHELRITQKELPKANAALALAGVEVRLLKGRLDCPRKHYRLMLGGFVKALARVLGLGVEWLKNFCEPFTKSIVTKESSRNRQKVEIEFAKIGTPSTSITTASSMHLPQISNINSNGADVDDFSGNTSPVIVDETQEGSTGFEERTRHGDDAPSPSSAVPLPDAVRRLVEGGYGWEKLPEELARQYLEKYPLARCIEAARSAINGHTPAGMFRWILDQTDYFKNAMLPPQPAPEAGAEVDTQEDLQPLLDALRIKQWQSAFSQLEIRLDRATFDTWLRDAHLVNFDEEDGVKWLTVAVRNTYARDMLAHRLYSTVCRIVCEAIGETVELRFEVGQRQPICEEMPLFKLSAQQARAENGTGRDNVSNRNGAAGDRGIGYASETSQRNLR